MRSDPGDKNILFEVQRKITSNDEDSNEEIINWETVGEVWGEKYPVSSEERVKAAQTSAEVLWRVRTWYRTFTVDSVEVLPNATYRLRNKEDGTVYQVTAVMDPDGRKLEHLWDVREGNL